MKPRPFTAAEAALMAVIKHPDSTVALIDIAIAGLVATIPLNDKRKPR